MLLQERGYEEEPMPLIKALAAACSQGLALYSCQAASASLCSSYMSLSMCPAEYTEHDVRRAQVERAVVVQSSALLARLPEAFRHIQHSQLGLWQQQQQQQQLLELDASDAANPHYDEVLGILKSKPCSMLRAYEGAFSELLLVGGKSCVCARCKAARYCCKACQVEHYKWHKALCRNKAQPAAAAPAAEPEGQETAAQQ
ncbi:hypothetical protein OEZ86_009853 [Tetradesmus obliquus]|uniref:MYND-type domain-containing protein n=1 Tax=Tetradesmus obliquus TaxID=3088 RepID=A0ABY8UNT5_TETOB|nr:hypothetical protein OEZ85_001291 [Tetradesmus obliquus]WIA43364.1 hypothetical protein OEZ86_009853 [Tetradesmus obliquus]